MNTISKGQIPLRYPARELACDVLASWIAWWNLALSKQTMQQRNIMICSDYRVYSTSVRHQLWTRRLHTTTTTTAARHPRSAVYGKCTEHLWLDVRRDVIDVGGPWTRLISLWSRLLTCRPMQESRSQSEAERQGERTAWAQSVKERRGACPVHATENSSSCSTQSRIYGRLNALK